MNRSDWVSQLANDKTHYHQLKFHEKEVGRQGRLSHGLRLQAQKDFSKVRVFRANDCGKARQLSKFKLTVKQRKNNLNRHSDHSVLRLHDVEL